jgi:hypothetical protein
MGHKQKAKGIEHSAKGKSKKTQQPFDRTQDKQAAALQKRTD